MSTIFIGIDPGVNGAVGSVIHPTMEVQCVDIEFNEKDVNVVWLREYLYVQRKKADSCFIVLEKVQGDPKFGGYPAFSFGKTVGMIKAICQIIAADEKASILNPTPQAWKKKILEGTAKDKEAAISYVRNCHPSFSLIKPRCKKPSHDWADALCMAHYGIQQYTSQGI